MPQNTILLSDNTFVLNLLIVIESNLMSNSHPKKISTSLIEVTDATKSKHEKDIQKDSHLFSEEYQNIKKNILINIHMKQKPRKKFVRIWTLLNQ